MIYEDALKLIAMNPEWALSLLEKELSLPNIPTPTMGGEVFWNTLAEHDGWKLQQNMITKHARILRPDNVRVAWGTVNGMQTALERLSASNHKNIMHNSASSDRRADAAERLKQLKELLDIGAITQEEFEKKKAELIDFI